MILILKEKTALLKKFVFTFFLTIKYSDISETIYGVDNKHDYFKTSHTQLYNTYNFFKLIKHVL